jgi:predicted acylesterase/phospholipase RssA
MTTTQTPALECDLIMKGGITSGVVYPLAVCKLAEAYKLKSVGGSSAGAIAAAAAAAAEFGRASGGFKRLAELPQNLTEAVADNGDSRLFTLFQPEPKMRRLFSLVTAGLGAVGLDRVMTMLGAALRAWFSHVLAGSAPGVVLVALGFLAGGPAQWFCLVAGVMLAGVGVAVGVGVGVFRDLARMPAAGFGLCSGNTPLDAKSPALVPWLHQTLQSLAGRSEGDPPLTFGDLEQAGIRLQLMTTNLSRRQPMMMPWDVPGYYFDPAHFRTLFPEDVVAQMHRPPSGAEDCEEITNQEQWLSAVGRAQALPLLPFPGRADLPVVVAVRMSLSFPGLIAAVPLHAVDFSLTKNKEVRQAGKDRYKQAPDVTPVEAATALPKLLLQRNWFSDGGISANLPLHFFDSALPRRPTFAINLADFPEGREKSGTQFDNSYLPVSNSAGLLRRQSVWHEDGIGALKQFFSSIIDTARTWVDEGQLSMPGYRDRIVTVFHDHGEGGMNLHMAPDTVLALSERGAGAAARLVDRFAGEQPGVVPGEGWDNHRWLRFRTATAAFSETLVSFRAGYKAEPPGTTPYSHWVGVGQEGTEASAELPSYPPTKRRRHAINLRTKGLVDMAGQWQTDPTDAFTQGTPEPRPRMRLVPSDGSADSPPAG